MEGAIDVDGCRLHYAVEGSGPAALFIQGVGVHGGGWRPQVDGFAARARCITFDNRGIGQSRPRGAGITVAQMARDAAAVLDALAVPAAHVVGHSLGGLIALQLALDRRARVRSLALLCTFARGADATRLSWRMLWLGLRSRVGTRRSRRAAFLELVLPPQLLRGADRAALAAELAPLFGHDLADQPPAAWEQLRALAACDATPRLAELAGVPTLVVSAEHDPIARAVLGRTLAAGIPGAAFTELAGASHGAPIHAPDVVNGLLDSHFARAERG